MAEPTARVLSEEPVRTLEDYAASGGGEAVRRARSMEPGEVVAEVTASGLRGRGGAGFPTGRKWASVVESAADQYPVYLVCNGAEGEPGTYKDRLLLARNPYQVLEGMLVAMYATGAERAYIGVKRRFTHQIERLVEARDSMVATRWAGADEIRIVPGPDEYLFGEEKALLEVVENKLPLPRILPPYELGLFATMDSPNPTVVNNVETMAHVAQIMAHGSDWFREFGTVETPGTMPFTVIGDVASAGVYELPMGTPLRTLITDIAGARDVQAIYSGTSNTVITADLLDLPMDFDSFADAGTGLGSGGFVVYDTSRDIVQVCAALTRFLAIESCGQCLACKLGTDDLWQRLERLVRGQGTTADIEEIRKRITSVTDLNRCYLPVGAQLLIGSTLEQFAEAFSAHVGVASPQEHWVPVPKIEHIDEATGEVTYDPEYHRKQPDWSYAPA